MAKYGNGIETKEIILETCRNLFYEIGYDNVTFDDIAREAGVYRNSIHYHFRSKNSIRKVIWFEGYKKNMQQIKLYLSDITLIDCVHAYVYWYKMLQDEKYRRFYSANPWEGTIPDADEYFLARTDIPLIYQIFGLKGNYNYEKMRRSYKYELAIVDEIEGALSKCIELSPKDYEFVEITEFQLKTIGKLFDIDHSYVNKTILEAENQLQNINLENLDTTLSTCLLKG